MAGLGTEEEDVQPRMRAVVAKDVFTGVLSDSFRPRKHKDKLCQGRTGLVLRGPPRSEKQIE